MDTNTGGSSATILERTHSPAPLWRTERRAAATSLASDLECDTVVLGAGITGLSIASRLSEAQSVVVLDANQIGEGTSGWNAGILSVDTTIDLSVIERVVGEAKTRELVDSLMQALERTRKSLPESESFWQSGSSLYVAAKPAHSKSLADELALRLKYGLPTRLLPRDEIKKHWRGDFEALELGGEQAVHPLKLLFSLADQIVERGSLIFENSPVVSWQHSQDRFQVRCREHVITAKHLVIAAGIDAAQFCEADDLSRLVVPCAGHILVTEASPQFAEMVKETGCIAVWDSLKLYHYVRYLPDGRVLVGGEETPATVAGTTLERGDESIRRLYNWAEKLHATRLPPIEHCWRASLVIPADGLPLLKTRQLNGNFLISAITDGLPFAMLLGELVAATIRNNGERSLNDLKSLKNLTELLSYRRKLALAARALKLLPDWQPLRRIALAGAFALMRLLDRLF